MRYRRDTSSAIWGSFTFGCLMMIFLALKVNAKIQLTGSMVGMLLSIVVLLLWPDSSPERLHLPVILILLGRKNALGSPT
jgi:hypothetical protein